MSFRNVVNDGTQGAPRLRLQSNLWVLSRLPRDGEEWSLPEKFDRIARAGFSGFEANPESEQEADELAQLCRERNIAIGLQAYPWTADDLIPRIELAHRMRAEYISAQVYASPLATAPEIADLLEEMTELVTDAGLPFFVETHRGRVTQDLRRTIKVIKKFPKIRFTGDFSHYVVAGEMVGGWGEEVWDAFRKIAKRCCNWHGRIGNGEQVQTDIGDGTNSMCQHFKKLWTLGMTEWLKKARPGDVLPFFPELGPPLYSITDLNGREISDRWEQCLVIKRLAEEAWSDAEAAHAAASAPATVTAGDTA